MAELGDDGLAEFGGHEADMDGEVTVEQMVCGRCKP